MNGLASAARHASVLILSFALVGAQSGPSVLVTSDPAGAMVYFDDKPVGETPLTIDRVTTGSHRVRVTRAGYLENLQTIDVAAAPLTHHVTLTPREDTTYDVNWLTKRKWLLLGAGGAVAAALLVRPSEPVTGGAVMVSPSTGLQAATPITFASQGAGGGSTGTLTYAWNFGDGASGHGPLVTHVYSVPGTFTVNVEVSDGKKSGTATGSVTIRSLAGTWRGTLAGAFGITMVLTQDGSVVAGTYSDQAATGPLTGSVRSASPPVNITMTPSGFPAASYVAEPSSDANTLTGTYRQQGLVLDLRVTRQ